MFINDKCIAQGLLFYGNEKRIEERSSYKVFTNNKQPYFKKGISISFEYSVQNIQSPGYILLLKDRKTGKAFNLSYLYNESKGAFFIFSEDAKKSYHITKYNKEEIKQQKWIPININIVTENDKAELIIGKDSVIINNANHELAT